MNPGGPKDGPLVALVAGETSGDMLAAHLLHGMRTHWPNLIAQGIGGPHMKQAQFDAWWPSEKLAVRGYVEVLRHYREILAIRNRLQERLLKTPPNLFIGVDAPDFNLDLERALKSRGIKTLHFICPSIWAWRPERVEKIRQSADHVLCIFPFEVELLAQHGISATYVGHPLASVIPLQPDKSAARRRLGLRDNEPVLAILPGSRKSEIHYLAPRFFAAAKRVKQSMGTVKIVVPAIAALQADLEQAASDCGMLQDVQIITGQSHTVLEACDVTLIASGTATLEAALFKRPMVIAYNMNWLSWQIMKRKQLQPWVGLPNILCRDFVVPELIQKAATDEALAAAVLDWFASPAKIAALQTRFHALHSELRRDTVSLATHAIQKILER